MRHSNLAYVFCAILSVTAVSCDTSDLNMGPDVLIQGDDGGSPGDASRPGDSHDNPASDAGTTVDGFSTWEGDAALPPVPNLVTELNAHLTLKYFDANTSVEAVADGRTQGVTYFVNFTDALGRYLYQSHEGCSFKDFHVFKPITAGESSGPLGVTNAGAAEVSVVLSNPSNVQIAALTESDAPARASGACRAPTADNYVYEGLAMIHNLTVGVRVTRTADRCATYCRARGDNSTTCTSGCIANATPFSAQAVFHLDEHFNVTPESSTQGTGSFTDNALNVTATLSLN